jgi:predicted transposase YdaD
VTKWKQAGLQEGRVEGRVEGRREGRLEGRLEGEALVLRRQLHKRFGELPQWVEEKLQHAGTEELEHWADSILDAPSLAGVFNHSH